MEHDLLKPEEVAKLLKISKYTVYEMVKRGELKAIRIGRKMRFDPDSITQFTNKQHPVVNNQRDVSDQIPFEPLPSLTNKEPILFLGSHDHAVEELANTIRESDPSVPFFTGFIGSLDGLMNLYFGKADITGCHLFDEETGRYNVPLVKRIFPNEFIHIIHFVQRNIGWIVPRGNPKNLTSWDDLSRSDLKMVNRQKGAGTRILLDYQLKQRKIDRNSINGYEQIEQTHFSSASKVARGLADVALGTESAARTFGLDFVFLTKENYDFVMKQGFLESNYGQVFMKVLHSPSLKEKINRLGGYDVNNIGKIVKEDE
ncbi:helix-turn-helix transcriptional regulator [Bacillus sp. Marseille-P3661]|uniref:helix-turn-helix transcriptional regulator n=1 Tax=Bacillus sp. Marseille-P3661 TaxID=1936234 RepID=UPI000C816C29|nr:helix-turn-helix transcriptional regulator [Bacillus sp. Marseille-P3661]